MPKTIAPEIIEYIVSTFSTILRLIRASGDKTLEEEALMEHQERTKEMLDRRAFTDSSSGA